MKCEPPPNNCSTINCESNFICLIRLFLFTSVVSFLTHNVTVSYLHPAREDILDPDDETVKSRNGGQFLEHQTQPFPSQNASSATPPASSATPPASEDSNATVAGIDNERVNRILLYTTIAILGGSVLALCYNALRK